MAFRFQKRIKIAPGIRVNLSKTGVSTSLGTKGATVNVSRGKTKLTVGAPGTGLSHSTNIGRKRRNSLPSTLGVFSAFFRGVGLVGTLVIIGLVGLLVRQFF